MRLPKGAWMLLAVVVAVVALPSLVTDIGDALRGRLTPATPTPGITTSPDPRSPGSGRVDAPPGPIRADRAIELLPRLDTEPPGAMAGYERDEFGYDWLDLDSDGCNSREEILARDMRSEVRPDGCNVETGVLTDPYTATRIEFVEDRDPMAVQIDHVIPLGYAWRMGASTWSDDKRERLANDPLNLIATDGSVNASKSDQGAAQWRPPQQTAWCLYSVRYVRVAAAYDLPVTAADVSALDEMLRTCP